MGRGGEQEGENIHAFSLLFKGTSYFCSVFVHAGVMSLQDMTLRPSLKDIDEELLHLVAEQSAANDMLAEKRQKDQALLDQMLPPQVNTTRTFLLPSILTIIMIVIKIKVNK